MILKTTFYRIRQWAFSMFMQYVPLRNAKLISGEGSIFVIPNLLQKEKTKNVLLVTTQGFIKRGTLVDVLEHFKEQGISVAIFSEVTPDPTTDCIEKAVILYKKKRCEAIVAIGGGSVIDCAKGVGARIARPKKSLLQMKGLLKVRKKIPDIYAVPTTAGTGSEATAGAVITDAKTHYKFTILDLCLVPKYAILDPELTVGLPSQITAVTGMDALTHAIEAYTNCFCTKKTKEIAYKSIQLIYENLLTAYEDGNNRIARENMLLASYYAGVAINYNFIGYVHAIAHGVGGMYGVVHGKANAIILPYVLELYGERIWKKLANLKDGLNTSIITGNILPSRASDKEKAMEFIASIRYLNEKLSIPKTIQELKQKDFNTLVNRAIKEANPMYPVPVIWNETDFKKALQKLVK